MNSNGWAIPLDSPQHATAGATDHSHPWHPVATTQTVMTFGTMLRHSSEEGSTTSWHSQNWVSPVGPKLHGPLLGLELWWAYSSQKGGPPCNFTG